MTALVFRLARRVAGKAYHSLYLLLKLVTRICLAPQHFLSTALLASRHSLAASSAPAPAASLAPGSKSDSSLLPVVYYGAGSGGSSSNGSSCDDTSKRLLPQSTSTLDVVIYTISALFFISSIMLLLAVFTSSTTSSIVVKTPAANASCISFIGFPRANLIPEVDDSDRLFDTAIVGSNNSSNSSNNPLSVSPAAVAADEGAILAKSPVIILPTTRKLPVETILNELYRDSAHEFAQLRALLERHLSARAAQRQDELRLRQQEETSHLPLDFGFPTAHKVAHLRLESSPNDLPTLDAFAQSAPPAGPVLDFLTEVLLAAPTSLESLLAGISQERSLSTLISLASDRLASLIARQEHLFQRYLHFRAWLPENRLLTGRSSGGILNQQLTDLDAKLFSNHMQIRERLFNEDLPPQTASASQSPPQSTSVVESLGGPHTAGNQTLTVKNSSFEFFQVFEKDRPSFRADKSLEVRISKSMHDFAPVSAEAPACTCNIIPRSTLLSEKENGTNSTTAGPASSSSSAPNRFDAHSRRHAAMLRLKPKHKTTFVVGVLTGAGMFGRRQEIRKSWMREAAVLGITAKFFLSIDETECSVDNGKFTCDPSIEQEQSLYGDIVLIDVESDYNSLIYKTYSMIKWAVQNFEFKYFLKTDDDSFVNVRKLARFLATSIPESGVEMGFPWIRAEIIEDMNSKWRNVPYKLATAWSQYPFYFSGSGTVITWDVAKAVVASQEFVPYQFWPREDATFATWLLAFNLQKLSEFRIVPNTRHATNPCTNFLLHHVRVSDAMRMSMSSCRSFDDFE